MSRSRGRLTPWPKIAYIFWTGKSTNFNVGIPIKYVDPHHRHAQWPASWKLWVSAQDTTYRGGGISWWPHYTPHRLLFSAPRSCSPLGVFQVLQSGTVVDRFRRLNSLCDYRKTDDYLLFLYCVEWDVKRYYSILLYHLRILHRLMIAYGSVAQCIVRALTCDQ